MGASSDVYALARFAESVLECLLYREQKRAPLMGGSRYDEQRAHWHAGNGYLDILGHAQTLGLLDEPMGRSCGAEECDGD